MIDRLVFSRLNYWAGLVLDLVAAVTLIVLGIAAADRLDHLLAAALAGAFVFSLYEYALHRWIYHHVPGPVRRIHRLHHRDRSLRIGSPFYFSLGICAITWILAALVVGRTLGAMFAGVILLGYATFSIVHHLSHSERPLPGWLDRKRQHHLAHHRHAAANFGVVTTLWDRVFGTHRSAEPTEE